MAIAHTAPTAPFALHRTRMARINFDVILGGNNLNRSLKVNIKFLGPLIPDWTNESRGEEGIRKGTGGERRKFEREQNMKLESRGRK